MKGEQLKMPIKWPGAMAASASLVVGLVSATGGVASADGYGSGTTYQVEISTNVPDEGVWLWAALGSGSGGDYQETDCIHLGGGHFVNGQPVDTASHAGGQVASWNATSGVLTMHGIGFAGGVERIGISLHLPAGGYGHEYGPITITYESGAPILGSAPVALPSQIQIAP